MRSVFDGSVLSNVQRLSLVSTARNYSTKIGGNEQDRVFEQVLRDLFPGASAKEVGENASQAPAKPPKQLAWNTAELLTNMAQAQAPTIGDGALSKAAADKDSKGGQANLAKKIEVTDPSSSVKEITPSVKTEARTPQIKDESASNMLDKITRPAEAGRPTALSPSEMKKIISKAGKYHGVDSLLGIAVAERESNFNPGAISNDGYSSKGLFQLLDSTGSELQQNYAIEQPYDPFNPRQNAYLGVGYLKQLMDYFSRETVLEGGLRTVPAKSTAEMEKLALAAFNAGIGTVARAQRKARKAGLNPASFEGIKSYLPEITRRYVPQVVRRRAELATLDSSELIG